MSKLFGILIVLFSACLIGCKTTGYLVTLSTPQLSYSEVEKIKNNLTSEGFKIGVKEREILKDKVQTNLHKELKNQSHWFLESYIKYKKDDQNKLAKEVELEFSNIYIGLITPEIKNQIDSLGNKYQEYLSDIAGKENVNIESKEWGPPKIY